MLLVGKIGIRRRCHSLLKFTDARNFSRPIGIRGRRVRIVPHADPAGAKAGLQWAGLLKELDCRVDGFDLRNLARADGSPVKDLNDCTAMTPEAQTEMNQMFT